MTGGRLARVQLKWGNPYTSPPDNQPRIIFDETVSDQAYQDRAIEDIIELEKQYPPGSGWSWHWSLGEEKPRRKWSKEAKARVRKKKLKTKLQTKFPLFWEDMYNIEMENRQGYFAGEDPVFVPLSQLSVKKEK